MRLSVNCFWWPENFLKKVELVHKKFFWLLIGTTKSCSFLRLQFFILFSLKFTENFVFYREKLLENELNVWAICSEVHLCQTEKYFSWYWEALKKIQGWERNRNTEIIFLCSELHCCKICYDLNLGKVFFWFWAGSRLVGQG